MKAEVVAIGSELTSGAKLDTNSQWLSLELANLGIPVAYHTTMADSLEAMTEVFRIASGRCDLVLITGGLGPTLDDITRDALAALLEGPKARASKPACFTLEDALELPLFASAESLEHPPFPSEALSYAAEVCRDVSRT